MKFQQAELYQRIQAFSLDEIDAYFPLSKRLARDNRWSANYTQRVIDEYKKFAFLAVVAGHLVTPSEQIDQVWHMHLIYTQSYWGEFCPKVLQMQLHHSPTRGGSDEDRTFKGWYNKTLASYKYFFGYTPPADIWPPTQIRFGRDLHVVRVNTQQNWIIPKPSLELVYKLSLKRKSILVLLCLLGLKVTGCEPLLSQNIKNQFNFSGLKFFTFYILIAIAIISFAYTLRGSGGYSGG
ncbi:MAG: hypothetical protein F6K36_12295 [Symploca sp. SIO3C6]|nr:hypothetical protein [Symploca sp. SIO3C6]